jgi:hypothetical protein
VFNGNVVAVTLNGDTMDYKKYISGEDIHKTIDDNILQCPLLYRYTSTEDGHIDTLHNKAINHGKRRKIHNFEDEHPGPWRTNGKAYINWVVGPKEVQMKDKGIYIYFYILISYIFIIFISYLI